MRVVKAGHKIHFSCPGAKMLFRKKRPACSDASGPSGKDALSSAARLCIKTPRLHYSPYGLLIDIRLRVYTCAKIRDDILNRQIFALLQRRALVPQCRQLSYFTNRHQDDKKTNTGDICRLRRTRRLLLGGSNRMHRHLLAITTAKFAWHIDPMPSGRS